MSDRPMGLSETEAAAVASCFRGTCKAMSFDSGSRLVLLQSGGHGGVQGGDPEFAPETLNKVPVVFPYGFLGMAPGGPKVETELLETAAGVICVAVRCALPSGVPAPSVGDATMYSSAGAYAKAAASGDVVTNPAGSGYVKLGANAAKKVPLDGDNVTVAAALTTWINAVTSATGVPALVGTTIGTVAATSNKVKAE